MANPPVPTDPQPIEQFPMYVGGSLKSPKTTVLNRIGGRKFLLAYATLFSASALVCTHRISDGVYSAVVIACVAAYITGNVAQKKLSSGGAE